MPFTNPISRPIDKAVRYSSEPAITPRPGLLVVGDAAVAALCMSGRLSASHVVEHAASLERARERVKGLDAALVVTELQLPDGDGVELCRAGDASQTILTLAVTSDPTRVPGALIAGCDSVLLKPFAPNLLYARIGRLTRDLQLQCRSPRATASRGTNRHWGHLACPSCDGAGATSFDATGLRRAWYACLACKHVWIAKRQE